MNATNRKNTDHSRSLHIYDRCIELVTSRIALGTTQCQPHGRGGRFSIGGNGCFAPMGDVGIFCALDLDVDARQRLVACIAKVS